MSRAYTTYADSSAKELLARLAAKPAPSPVEYRQYMVQLGAKLGEVIARESTQREGCFVACTNEDADFVARGLLTELEMSGFPDIAFACFWNDRKKVGELEFAPIIRKYMEPATAATALIVVKAIIATGCVVKTNIQELLSGLKPDRIIIAAPVMMKGAQEKLESDFDPQVRSRFSYICFAEDDTRNENGEVVPGIGGMVYQLLGIGDSATKNSYTPSLVQWRRRTLPSFRSGKPNYHFGPEHHGHAVSDRATWLKSIRPAQELLIFQTAYSYNISDDDGWLYGVSKTNGGLEFVGTQWQQLAAFRPFGKAGSWQGFPLGTLKTLSPLAGRKKAPLPEKEIFEKMRRAGLISLRDRKRLARGDYV